MSSTYYPPDPDDERPLGELFSELTEQLQFLLRKEVELAKAELQEQASRAVKGAVLFAAMGVIGFVGFILLSFAAAWGAAEVINQALAFLAVGLIYLVVAGLLFTQARQRMAGLKPVPAQTMQTLQQDVQTAKTSLSKGMADKPPWGSETGRRP
jgi:uncharacterized membrane protein YqjE